MTAADLAEPDRSAPPLPPNRAQGRITAHFRATRSGSAVGGLHESGGLRLRFPNVPKGSHPGCEAVCINTGGGMVGGDEARYAFRFDAGAAATLTTQSAEKIYRSNGQQTRVDVALDLAEGATAEWLPQETILFDGVNLRRQLDVAMSSSSRLLLTETIVFGRLAMGETVRRGAIRDRWRVRRDGRLVFAEDLRIEGDIAERLDRPATGQGARAIATLLLVAPDAEDRLDAIRDILAAAPAEAGASAWNGLLSVRALSPSPDRLRATIVSVLETLRGRVAPRVWQ